MPSNCIYEIRPEDELFRRVKLPVPPNTSNDFIKILENGEQEVSRLVFRPDPKRDLDGLSVNVINLDANLISSFPTDSHTGVIIQAKIPIELSCPCIHDPLPYDQSHALIKNLMDQKGKQAQLAIACRPI